MNISRFSVKHTPVLSMILISLVLFGFISVASMNIEFTPDLTLPEIFVITIYPGASAEEVESSVINIMEDNFVTLPNFSSMDSMSMNSIGVITIEFTSNVKPEDQVNEVRSRIDDLTESLPSGIEKPQVVIGGASMLPILSFTVEGGEDIAAISEYVNDTLLPKITRIDGVSTVEVVGGIEKRLSVKLRTEDMDSKGISAITVYQILAASNASLPLGNIETESESVTLKFDGSFDSPSEIELLPIGANDSGEIIRIGDVADVFIEYVEPDYSAFADGRDIVVINVSKRTDGNTYRINSQIKKILEESERETSGALKYGIISDDTLIIRAAMRNLIISGAMGVAIAILVIFLFLNDLKATLIIGVSIPLSIFFSFIAMKIVGFSINLMTLSGIVVALGSIVDASIVVLDQIYRFYQMKNDDGTALYSVTDSIFRGTDVVDKSVIGSNLTTVVVFIPIAMISGIVGSILRGASITILFAILSSLAVALVFVPYLAKKILKDDGSREAKKDSIVVKGINTMERKYKDILTSALRHNPLVITICVLVLIITVYSLTRMNFAFIPSTDNDDFYISISLPYGYTSDDTKKAMEEAERILKENVPELKSHVVFAGKSVENFSFSQDLNQGGIHAVLVPVSERKRSVQSIVSEMQYKLSASLPGATVKVKNGGFDYLVGYITDGASFGVRLIGSDKEELYEEALKIRDFLLNDPEVLSAEVNSSYDAENSVIRVNNEDLSSLGLTSYEVAATTSILFNGMGTGSIYTDPTDGSRYEIYITSDIADKSVTNDTLQTIKIPTSSGGTVSLGSVATMSNEKSLSQINHTNRAVSMTVTAEMTVETVTGINARLRSYFKENPLPYGITREEAGTSSLLVSAIPSVMKALMIALFLVFAIIVIIYERFDQPFIIMLLTPFCVIGVTFSLAIFGSSLNVMSLMGIITLTGMLVNNGIIMVDYANSLEKKSRMKAAEDLGVVPDVSDNLIGYMSYKDEIRTLAENMINSGTSRMRPILMSALTTILGVVPMALGTGEGSEIYAPLGQVIMGGLTTSTFLTLFLMPVFYFLLEKRRIIRAFRKKGLSMEDSE